MKLGRKTPILGIFDVGKAREFYVGFLRFSVDWEDRFSEDHPLYMQVSRGDCILHLSERFFFFGNVGLEPPHIHVQRDRNVAKFWLRPVALASAGGLAAHELGRLHRLVEENREQFEEAWHAFFSA